MRQASERGVAGVVERNVAALLEHRERAEAARETHDRIADGITRFVGGGRFLYLHLGILIAWFVINRGWTPIAAFDKTFALLGTITAIEAIFLATLVLISQRRMAAIAEERAELNLQICLLAEHEVTQILKLMVSLAEKFQITVAEDSELEDLKHDVPPEVVLDHMAEQRKKNDFKSQ